MTRAGDGERAKMRGVDRESGCGWEGEVEVENRQRLRFERRRGRPRAKVTGAEVTATGREMTEVGYPIRLVIGWRRRGTGPLDATV